MLYTVTVEIRAVLALIVSGEEIKAASTLRLEIDERALKIAFHLLKLMHVLSLKPGRQK